MHKDILNAVEAAAYAKLPYVKTVLDKQGNIVGVVVPWPHEDRTYGQAPDENHTLKEEETQRLLDCLLSA